MAVSPARRAVSNTDCPGAMKVAFRDVVMVTPEGLGRGKLPLKTFPRAVTRLIEQVVPVVHPVSAALFDAYEVVMFTLDPTPIEKLLGSTFTFVELTRAVEQEGTIPMVGLRHTSVPSWSLTKN